MGAGVENAANRAGVAAPAELRAAFEQALAAHLAKDPSLFAAALADHGTDPGRFARPESDTLERWSRATRLLRDGRFDQRSVVVRRRLVASRDRVALAGNAISAARDAARPWLNQIPENQRQSVEIVMNGEWVDGDGGRFKGSVGYEFMWVPGRRSWYLYRFHVYDFPSGRLATIPPV
jgi:hypothetical protein